MKNFLIGMYGRFDDSRYRRDFRKDFWGVEACMFPDRKEAKILADKARQEGFKFGVHFPLLQRNRKVRDPLFLSPDKEERAEAVRDFAEEAEFVSRLGAEYILTHFPKPFLMDRKLDWSFWRFADDKERIFEDENPYEVIEEYCFEVFRQLYEISDRHKIKVMLENDAYNRYFYKTKLLPELFGKYPEIGLCLDFGRLHLQERVDKDFSGVRVISDLAPYMELIHLWNVKAHDNVNGGHYPALPEQSAEKGWGDMDAYLKALTYKTKEVKVLFEHRSDWITDEDLERCYRWVNGYFQGERHW